MRYAIMLGLVCLQVLNVSAQDIGTNNPLPGTMEYYQKYIDGKYFYMRGRMQPVPSADPGVVRSPGSILHEKFMNGLIIQTVGTNHVIVKTTTRMFSGAEQWTYAVLQLNDLEGISVGDNIETNVVSVGKYNCIFDSGVTNVINGYSLLQTISFDEYLEVFHQENQRPLLGQVLNVEPTSSRISPPSPSSYVERLRQAREAAETRLAALKQPETYLYLPLPDTFENALMVLDKEAHRMNLVVLKRSVGEERSSTIYADAFEMEVTFVLIKGTENAFQEFVSYIKKDTSFKLLDMEMFSSEAAENKEGSMKILCTYRTSQEQARSVLAKTAESATDPHKIRHPVQPSASDSVHVEKKDTARLPHPTGMYDGVSYEKVDDLEYAFIIGDGAATIVARGQPRQMRSPTVRPYPSGKLKIPLLLGGVPVTAIDDNAFYSYRTDSLIAVTIPASVAMIGDMAFGGCAGLRAVFFEGNAPTVRTKNPQYGLFTSTPDNCTVYVQSGSTGWDGGVDSTVLPPLWHGKRLMTYTPEEKAETLQSLLPEIRTETIDGITYSYTVSEGKATLIGDWSKKAKRNLNNVNYPLRDRALLNDPEGTLTIPAAIGDIPITAIGDRAFNGCAKLIAVTIPEGVESIGKAAFSGCRQLESIKLPDSLARIDAEAFYYCDRLRSISIPRKTEQIGVNAFSFCTNLVVIAVEKGNDHFADVDGVLYDRAITNLVHCPYARQEIVIPDSVVLIPGYRFQNYKVLSSLVLSKSVATITPEVFKGWKGLASIAVSADNPHFTVYDGILYDKTMKTLIRCPPAREGEVIIPEGVETIANVAFENCVNLTRIILPEGLKRIGGISRGHITGTFYNCEKLTEITLPASLEYLGYCTFGRCRNLKRAFFKGNAPKTSNGTFWNTDTTVYYLAGTSGWGTEFDKRPTMLWDPENHLSPSNPPSAIPVTAKSTGSVMSGLFGGELCNAKNEKVAVDKLDGKLVGIYFSAHWCPPCRTFTPKLVEFHKAITDAGKPFEIVFVSSDKDGEAMSTYMQESSMPWLAVPFGDPKVKELKEKFNVRSIPTLVVVNAKGETVSTKARSEVTQIGAASFDAWAKH